MVMSLMLISVTAQLIFAIYITTLTGDPSVIPEVIPNVQDVILTGDVPEGHILGPQHGALLPEVVDPVMVPLSAIFSSSLSDLLTLSITIEKTPRFHTLWI
jgi:hypothetical protein